MLHYVDAKRALRVVRSDDLAPKARSVLVAAIAKKTFEIKFAEHANLSAGERLEIEGVAARFRAAAEMGERPIVWRFLEDVRRVAEYCSTQADEVEKRIISTTLQRSERAIRK